MATIQVTPDLLNSQAQQLRGIKANHDQAMNEMRNLITNLNQIWKGAAQDAYLAKYESMRPVFDNFSQMIEEYAALMNTAANAMQETDQTLSNTMSSSFGG